jgi:cation:H+ antiporter
VIAEKSGLGRTWIGVILMASVTSLPELVTGISSVAIYSLPNIAAGDVLGSCMFNLLILAMLDIKRNGSPISALAHQGHVLTAAFGIVLLGLVAISILASDQIPAIGWIGLYSPLFALTYVVAMRIVFRYERTRAAGFVSDAVEGLQYGYLSKSGTYGQFGVHALVIVAAATYLPHLGDEIATITGLGRTFVGSIFIALATSLPEIVVSRAALKMGAVDLAVGNILGSNLFNIAILAIDDAFFLQGPILANIEPSHTITAVAAMTMTAIVTIALTYRSEKRILLFPWESVGVALVYVLTSLVLYAKR